MTGVFFGCILCVAIIGLLHVRARRLQDPVEMYAQSRRGRMNFQDALRKVQMVKTRKSQYRSGSPYDVAFDLSNIPLHNRPKSSKFPDFDILAAFAKTFSRQAAARRKVDGLHDLQYLCHHIARLGIRWRCTRRAENVDLTTTLSIRYEVAFGYLSNVVHLTPSSSFERARLYVDCTVDVKGRPQSDIVTNSSKQCSHQLVQDELVMKYPLDHGAWKKTLDLSSETWTIKGQEVRLFPYSAALIGSPMSYHNAYYSFSEYLGGFVSLRSAFSRVIETPSSLQAKAILRLNGLVCLAYTMLKLKSIFHNDAHFENILVWNPSSNRAKMEFYANEIDLRHFRFVDLDSASYGKPNSSRQRYETHGDEPVVISYKSDHILMLSSLRRRLSSAIRAMPQSQTNELRLLRRALDKIYNRCCSFASESKCLWVVKDSHEQFQTSLEACRAAFLYRPTFDPAGKMATCEDLYVISQGKTAAVPPKAVKSSKSDSSATDDV